MDMIILTNITMKELRKLYPPNLYDYNNLSTAVENGKTIVRYVEVEKRDTQRKTPLIPCTKAARNFIMDEDPNIVDVISVEKLKNGFLIIALKHAGTGNKLITKKYYVNDITLEVYEVTS